MAFALLLSNIFGRKNITNHAISMRLHNSGDNLETSHKHGGRKNIFQAFNYKNLSLAAAGFFLCFFVVVLCVLFSSNQ